MAEKTKKVKTNRLKTRRMSIKVKILVPAIAVMVVICALMGVNSYQRFKENMIEAGGQQGNIAAGYALKALDGSKVKVINQNGKDCEEYDSMLQKLTGLKKTCDIDYLYTIYTDGKTLYYGVDANDDPADPGDVYPMSYDELKTVFEGNTYIKDSIEYTSKGEFVSVYKPIRDGDGNVIGALGCDYDASKIASELRVNVRRTVQIGGICLLIGIVALTVILNRILNGLTKVNNKLYELANNDGDLTQKLKVKSGDELELIAGNVNDLLEYIRGIMSGISKSSSKLTDASAKMLTSIDSADSSITDVSAAMEEMSAAMGETTTSLSQIQTAISNVYEAVGKMAGNALEGKNYADEMEKRSQTARDKAVASQENALKDAADISVILKDKIEQSKAVEQIAVLTSNIIEITDQTNLLALNASIEAARAGEAGKGFAVVADEIGKLAGNSASVAEQIRKVSASVIDTVNDLAEESEKMIEFVQTTATSGYGDMVKLSEVYRNDANAMSVKMTDFASDSSELNRNMDEIRVSIEAVNTAVEESANAIAEVSEDTTNITGRVDDIQEKASGNNRVAEELLAEVRKFRLE